MSASRAFRSDFKQKKPKRNMSEDSRLTRKTAIQDHLDLYLAWNKKYDLNL